MQSLDLVLDIVLIFAFLTFYGTIAWGLIRYSTKRTYRYWALGWLVYTMGAIQGAFVTGPGLVLQDMFSLSALYVGATLILDGTRTLEITRRRISIYAIGVILLVILTSIGVFFSIAFHLIFTPLGLHIAYTCYLSTRMVSAIEGPDLSKRAIVTGLSIWGISWLFFPFTAFFFEFYGTFILVQAIGVFIVGSSMLTLFVRTVTHDLETQYQVSQIISGLVQHDIRNYIQTAWHALELTEIDNVVENHWINIATEVLEDAGHFVDDMRDIAVSLSSHSVNSEPTSLTSLVERTVKRVVQEYDLASSQILENIPTDSTIESSRLIDELLWNIFDNAFKHGSQKLTIQAIVSESNGTELEILDDAGGLPEKIKTFLNSPKSLSRPENQRVGIGVVLIRGISSMCGINIRVSDNVEDTRVIGTKYLLRFNVSK